MPDVESPLPPLLAVVAVVSLAAAVPVAFPGSLGYGCGGPQGADLDRSARGQWLVLKGGMAPADEHAVVARYSEDWRELARYDIDLPANATGDGEYAAVVSLTPSAPEGDGFWVVTRDDRAYKFARNGSFTGETSPARVVRDAGDPGADLAPDDAIDWEVERYGGAVDAEYGTDADAAAVRNYVLARDGTVLEYTTGWQFTGVTHRVVDGSECFGERPAWPSAWELLVASTAVGVVGLALTSWLARDDLGLAAVLAVGGPVLAGTVSMYLLPDYAGGVYALPDLALGAGLLAPVAAAGWYVDEDPVVSLPLLALSGAALVAAGVRYLLASGLP